MKTRYVFFVVLATIFLTSSRCVSLNGGISPSKNYITRDFKVGSFDKLDLSTVADVHYTQSIDGSTSLQVYGSDNLVELVKVDVKDNTLVLKMKKQKIGKSDLKITISSPNLQRIKSQGVGDLNIEDKIETTSLVIRNEGVGDIKINNVVCQDMDILNEGVGDVKLRGKAETAILMLKGVGDISAAELESKSVTATSEGVGDISCYATQSINARAAGVGDISYKGNPTTKDLKKNGVGSIKQK